jgi:hypothetical protein
LIPFSEPTYLESATTVSQLDLMLQNCTTDQNQNQSKQREHIIGSFFTEYAAVSQSASLCSSNLPVCWELLARVVEGFGPLLDGWA